MKFIFIVLLIPFLSFSQVQERNLDLAIGIDEIVKLDYKFSSKIQIGDESVLRLQISPRRQEITFKGVKPGKSTVTVREDGVNGKVRDRFVVNVTSDGQSNTVRQIRELIGDVEGVEVGIKGGKVYVEGELTVPQDIGRVAVVLDGFKDVLRLIEVSPQTQRIIGGYIQDELSRNGMKDVSVRVVNKVFWLEGVVNSEGKKELAQKLAEAYIPGKWTSLVSNTGRFNEAQRSPILNFISVNEQKDAPPPEKQVKISAQFVELAKDYKRAFGFKWAPFMSNAGSLSFGKTQNTDSSGNTTSGAEITTEENNTLSGTISQLFPKLSTAREAGYARVIQQGMVITRSKQQARISKTKDIPFAIGSGDFSRPSRATISFNLSVTPEVAESEEVKLDGLNISISLPSGSTNTGDPVTTQNNIETNITVKNKDSAVIGGIVQNTSTTGYDKNDPDPSTGTSQAAGGGQGQQGPQGSTLVNLLRSKSYVTEKSQFVVFVTPEIVESLAENTKEIKKKFRMRQR